MYVFPRVTPSPLQNVIRSRTRQRDRMAAELFFDPKSQENFGKYCIDTDSTTAVNSPKGIVGRGQLYMFNGMFEIRYGSGNESVVTYAWNALQRHLAEVPKTKREEWSVPIITPSGISIDLERGIYIEKFANVAGALEASNPAEYGARSKVLVEDFAIMSRVCLEATSQPEV